MGIGDVIIWFFVGLGAALFLVCAYKGWREVDRHD